MDTSTFENAFSEAQLLHGRDDQCAMRTSDALYFSIFRKTCGRTSQMSYRMPLLESVVNATAGHDDTYMSQSSFWKARRKIVNFKQTRAAWVDLDLYNIGKTVNSAMITQILLHGEQLGIPAPTSVIYSGRGCYLKWIFEVPVTQTQLFVWQQLQATLTAAYSSLAADFKARDAARVFRLLQTRNSKSGDLVSTIDGSGTLYDFGTLCCAVESLRADLLVEQTRISVVGTTVKSKTTRVLAASAERGDPEALSLYSELRRPIMLKGLSEQSLNWARFCDLRDLFAVRGGIPVGERDNTMFWMLNFLSHAQVIRAADWDSEIKQLLCAFPHKGSFDPVSDGSMSTLLGRLKDKESGKKYKWRGVDVSPLYRPSNDFLIDAFDIKIEEMAGLSTIISGQEKRNRVDAKNEGRAQNRQERLRWREEVREVFEADQKNKLTCGAAGQEKPIKLAALARFVGVERSRLSRYWHELAAGTAPEQAALAASSVKKLKGLAAEVPVEVGPGAGLSLPQAVQVVSPVEADRALKALEAARQAKLAQALALEAVQAATALAHQRKIAAAQERWVTRKLSNVLALTPVDPVSNSSNEEKESAVEIGQQSNNLFKKMALLNVAKDPSAALVRPAAPVPAPAAAPALNPVVPGAVARKSSLQDRLMNATQRSQSAMSASKPQPSPQLTPQPISQPSPVAPAAMPTTHGANGASLATPAVAPAVEAAAAVKRLTPQQRIEASRARTFSRPPPVAPVRINHAAGRPPQDGERERASAVALVEGGAPAPDGYPGADAWASNRIAPGSRYSEEEWIAARSDTVGNDYDVFEMQSPFNSWLVQLIKPVGTPRINEHGGVATELQYSPDVREPVLCSLIAQVFSDCILVSQKVAPAFPGAIEGAFDLGGATYRVIRPRIDYLEPSRAFRVNAKMIVSTGFGDVAEEDESSFLDAPAPF